MTCLEEWEGHPMAAWELLWSIPRFEAHDTLPSTNDRVRELAGEQATAFTVVTAETQTAGRGRSGKRWESARGMGLWISFLLRPEPRSSPALAPVLVGLAAAAAIESLCPELRPQIKWPNDLLVDGRKLAGILCEGVGSDAVVVGVGINIRHQRVDFPRALRDQATSLEAQGCAGVTRSSLAERLLVEARELLTPLPSELGEGLRREIRRRDALVGRRVRTDIGRVGKAVGVSADGALLVESEGTRYAITGGSVGLV